MADQDGGAHVDLSIERDYYRLTRVNTMGVGLVIEKEREEAGIYSADNVHLAIVRQIAHEIIRTIERELIDIKENGYLKEYNTKVKILEESLN